jgi:hypothetical protein
LIIRDIDIWYLLYSFGCTYRSKAGWLPRKEVPLKVTTGRNMLGGLMSGSSITEDASEAPGDVAHPPKKNKSPAERKAIREKKLL